MTETYAYATDRSRALLVSNRFRLKLTVATFRNIATSKALHPTRPW